MGSQCKKGTAPVRYLGNPSEDHLLCVPSDNRREKAEDARRCENGEQLEPAGGWQAGNYQTPPVSV